MVGATDLRLIIFTSTASGVCDNDFSRKSSPSLSDDRHFPSLPVRPAGCSVHSQHSIEGTWRLICSRYAAAATHHAADELVAAKVADGTQG